MESSSCSSSSHQNWLGFSLSNTSHLCLFEAFNTTTSSSPPPQEDDASRATDLSIFTSTTATTATATGPKLEDFLGSSTNTTTAPPPPPQFNIEPSVLPQPVTTTSDTSEIYDSELKTIAASFLRGFSSSASNNQENDIITQKQQQQQQQSLLILPHQPESAPRKTVDTFGQRTSIYRGVTRHRWTGRYEAHLWDNSCRREGQSRKGRQVYLGGYDKEEKAARAYDLAALKYWGPTTTTNFPISNYQKELEDMKHMTRQEFVASLRRKSSGFSRGASIYRGVTRHHQHGRWQARIGRVAGNKDLYLGTFSTQEEAAEAYDIAAIKFRGLNAVTNFDMSRYDVKSIATSNLPIGGISSKSKNSSDSASDSKSIDGCRSADDRDHLSSASSVTFAAQAPPPPAAAAANSTLSFAIPIKQDPSDFWSNILRTQNNITPNNTVTTAANGSALFQSFPGGSTTFSMDFNVNESSNNNGLLFNGGYLGGGGGSGGGSSGGGDGISTSNVSSSIPFATPIGLNSNGSNYEGNSSYGGWIAQALHSYQSAKPSLSMFQTPIFGME